jgi:uncharacterized RDD family membrane protein YckC
MQQEQPEHQDIREVAPDTFVDETGHQLTKKEVREIVTPHAFVVSDELIGQPLAKPLRRGLAMSIDGVIISGLASASLIFVLPVMLYLCWNRYKAKKTTHLLLMVLATLITPLTLNWAPHWVQEKDDSTSSAVVLSPTAIATLVRLTQQVVKNECEERCAEESVKELAAELQKAGAPVDQQKELLDELLDQTGLKGYEKKALLRKYVADPKTLAAEPAVLAQLTEKEESSYSALDQLKKADYSLIKWVKGILADFGLGFGWAMVYFTFYTSWNNGQTIGKRLTRIRVVQLDNQPLSLWASFSRQGGYGAGFATGLVGFAQILWDPNRQAIQDKVASTVVLYKP